MAKRIQKQEEEERVVSNSRPTVMKMSSYLMSSTSSAASSPIASKSPGTSGASVGGLGSRLKNAASSFDAASASQVKLKDAYLGGSKEKQLGDLPHEREGNSWETDDSESEPWYYRLAPQNNGACGKPLAGGSAESASSELQKSEGNNGATTKHFLAISPDHVPYMNDVYNMVRRVYSRPASDPVKDVDVNMAFWWMFMNATLRTAIHLVIDHVVNLRNVQKFFLENYKTTFRGCWKVDQWSNRDYCF